MVSIQGEIKRGSRRGCPGWTGGQVAPAMRGKCPKDKGGPYQLNPKCFLWDIQQSVETILRFTSDKTQTPLTDLSTHPLAG